MEKEMSDKKFTELFEALSMLKTPKEGKAFMRDLCTFSELKAMAERWQVAKKINKNLSYQKIREMTGASTTTVTRVAHWLHHGMGGYKQMLERQK
jgi:TrpR-related protein YerC/YecD